MPNSDIRSQKRTRDFEMQWRLVAKSLYDFIAASSRQEADALDIFQNTTLIALRDYQELKSLRAFWGWICRIAYRCQLRYYRDRHMQILPIEELEDREEFSESFLAALVEGPFEQRVREYIEEQPKEWGDMLYLHLHYGCPITELCQMFHMDYSRVQRRLHRMKGQLRQVLEEGGYRHEDTAISDEEE